MPPSGELVEAARSPSEAARLLGERARWFSERGLGEWIEPVASTLDAILNGRSEASLWVGPKDEAVALVLWRSRGPGWRMAETFSSEGYRAPRTVRALVERIEAASSGPVVRLDLFGGEGTPRELAPELEPIGYRWVDRRELRLPPERPVPPAPEPAGVRPPRPDDVEALAELIADAFRDFPVDPAFFSVGGAPEEEAKAGVRALFDGTYGPAHLTASSVVERDGKLLGAVLVNDFHGPLIAEVAVARSARGQGLARALLARAVGRLREEGAPAPRLVVTWANVAARTLYLSLGFEVVALPESTTWSHFGRLGHPEVERFLGPPLSEGRVP